MTNDPNDRFMISDLSSKLSAYINGEDSAASSLNTDSVYNQDRSGDLPQREARNSGRGLAGRNSPLGRGNSASPPATQAPRTDRNIEDALASEIKPAYEGTRVPADTLFSDLDQALDTHEDTMRNRQLRQQQQREAQQRQYEEEQRRQKQEEQRRQEQMRLQQEEQRRQKQLQEEQAAARVFAKSLYAFDSGQPYQSLYSGHTIKLSEMPVKKKKVPPEIVKAAISEEIPETAAPDTAAEAYGYAGAAAAGTGSTEEPRLFEGEVPSESALDSFVSTTAGPFSEYSYDPEEGRRNDRRGRGKAGFIIALIGALLIGAVLFFMIRNYSSKIMGLVAGTQAALTSSTSSSADSSAGESRKTESAAKPDSAAAQAESVHADNQETDGTAGAGTESAGMDAAPSETETEADANGDTEGTGEPAADAEGTADGEAIPEDPNDITYLAAVNEKASADAIAQLSPEAPRLYLSSYAMKISAGTSFNALAYVENIEDDADDRSRLYGDISVDGLNEFNANVPGTYELVFYCYDSSANRSNKAAMTVIVE